MREETYDVVVIGAGPAGENVGDRVVRGGLTCAIVEAALVGGECSYYACMPSKALLRTGMALRAAQRVGVSGTFDPLKVLERRSNFTSHWNDAGQVKWLDGKGIVLYRGAARIEKERTVMAGDIRLVARHAVVVSTGSRALVPDIPGVDRVSIWTNVEATRTGTIPPRLVVVGGGVVACELATAFHSLGSAVTMLVRGKRLLPRQEPFAGERVGKALVDMGVRVEFDTRVEKLAPGQAFGSDGKVHEFDEILMATGRKAGTEGLGLDSIGLKNGDWLKADTTGHVQDGWLYAVGDVTNKALLTHIGKYQARACGDAIVARLKGTYDDRPWSPHQATAETNAVPQVVFTDPEVAAVGLTVTEAKAKYKNIRSVDYDMGHVAGASLEADHYQGWARMVVDEDRQVVVGATFVGQDVGDLVHSATVAIVGQVPLARLWHAVPSYPTVSEVWLRLLEAYGL